MLGLSAIGKASEVVTSSHYAVTGNDKWQVGAENGADL